MDAAPDPPVAPPLADNLARAAEFRLRAFVHDWFAFFDRMDPDPAAGVALLDPATLTMEFPGAPAITTPEGFAKWYAAGLARYNRYAHPIQSIAVAPVDECTAVIIDELVWQAELNDGTSTARRTRHAMTVRHGGGADPRIRAYRATPLLQRGRPCRSGRPS